MNAVIWILIILGIVIAVSVIIPIIYWLVNSNKKEKGGEK